MFRILSESAKFYRRYDKTISTSFFPLGHGIRNLRLDCAVVDLYLCLDLDLDSDDDDGDDDDDDDSVFAVQISCMLF